MSVTRRNFPIHCVMGYHAQYVYSCVCACLVIYFWSFGTQPATAHPDWHKCFPVGNGRRAGQEDFSQPVCASEDSSGPLRANQGIFKAEPRDSNAVCTLRVHPPTSPCPALSAVAEPISWSHCRKWRHKRKVSCRIYPATSGKGLREVPLYLKFVKS